MIVRILFRRDDLFGAVRDVVGFRSTWHDETRRIIEVHYQQGPTEIETLYALARYLGHRTYEGLWKSVGPDCEDHHNLIARRFLEETGVRVWTCPFDRSHAIDYLPEKGDDGHVYIGPAGKVWLDAHSPVNAPNYPMNHVLPEPYLRIGAPQQQSLSEFEKRRKELRAMAKPPTPWQLAARPKRENAEPGTAFFLDAAGVAKWAEELADKIENDNLTDIAKELDRVFRFLAGLNLQDHPLAEQKEHREVVHRFATTLQALREHKK